MVAIASSVKKCKYCGQYKFIHDFFQDRRGIISTRCKSCHGLVQRTCTVCGNIFEGKPNRKTCSEECHRSLRPVTYRHCAYCGVLFGPLPRLKQKYCSMQCKVNAQKTGRRTFHKATAKARRAQSLVRYHVLTGRLVRPNVCEECGATDRRIEAAHYDYDKPLKVRWLCRSCHARWDKMEPKNGTVVVSMFPEFSGRKAERLANEEVAA